MLSINDQLFTHASTLRVRGVTLSATDDLQTHREKLARIVLDEMYQFVGLLDADGMTLEINRAALEGAGIRLDDIQGKPFWETRWWQVSRETQDYQRDLVQRARQGEFVRCDIEIYGQAAGEETIIIDFSLLPVKDHDGNIVFLLAEGRNITEKKRAEAEIARKNEELQRLLDRIRHLDQLKSDFFANVSHELRTPLALILGPVEAVLTTGDNLTELQRRDLAVIQRNATTLLKHVNDLLDVAKLDAGKMSVDYVRVDLAREVRTVAAHFEALAPQRSLAYVITTPDALEAEIDPEKFARILLNLLSNAFKFTPTGGRIRCALETSGEDRLLLSVQDSGSGVEPEMRTAIFERFRQAQAGTTRDFGGTGLGLAIAKDFVDLHEGTIAVSDAPGGGALFQVEIPRRAPAGAYVRSGEATPEATEGGVVVDDALAELQPIEVDAGDDTGSPDGPLVLVAEDNAEMRHFITRVLGDEYRVVPAADGVEALEKALAVPPDLVVTDLMMPKLGGDRLIAEMRSPGPLAQVPVLVLSAKADEGMRLKLLAESVQDYVIKPFSAHELRVRVRNLVTMKRARDALQQELATQNEDLWQLTQQFVAGRQALQRSLQAQQKSEQRWQTVFENSAVGIGLTDLNGGILEANPALQRFLGYGEAELQSMSVLALIPEKERDASQSGIAELLDGSLQEHHVERRYLRRDGSVVWGNTSVSVVPGTERMPRMLVGIVEDITERKRSEQRLATQYAITRELAESEPIGDAMPNVLQAIGESMAWEWGALWNVDRDAGVLRCASIWHAPHLEAVEFDAINRESAAIPGSGLKGRVWQSAEPTWIADVSQAPNLRRASTAARLGLRGAIAFPILLRGETIGIMEFFSRVVRQPDDEQLVTLSAIGSQIGQFIERKRLEEEQRKLAALVENSTDFIGIASPEGQALFVNAAGQKMLGLDGGGHVRATRVLDYVVEEERQRVQQQVLPSVMRHGHWEGETQFRHFKTGAAIPMLQHVFCIQEPGSDRPIALATISRDMTERKQAEEALREAQAELAHATRVMTLGELAASIAHEVNQPLTAVINNSNACLRWLARQSPDLEGVREALKDIIANGQRASDVIARIRAALKKAPTQMERLEINHIIAEVIELTYHEVQHYGIQLHTELASDLPAVLGDRVQLQQVLLNLVVNGIDAMSTVVERPRQLLIQTTWAEPEGVLVAVQDSGIGLDQQALERIFDAFYTTKAMGMGMGLSISRTIIKAHGGRLWAERNPGPGATLQCILPRATEN